MYKRIYETDLKFWAVVGSQGCREKKTPHCHKYATFWGGFLMFSRSKNIPIYFLNTLASAIKKLHNIDPRKILKNIYKRIIMN